MELITRLRFAPCPASANETSGACRVTPDRLAGMVRTSPAAVEGNPGKRRREAGTVVRRALALPEQAASGVITAGSHTPRVPTEWEPHSHPSHELVWVRGGTVTSRVQDRVFTVSEGYGLWMPAGVVHGGRSTAGAEFHDAFFTPDRTPFAFGEPSTIRMTPLLESLLTHLARTDLDDAARARGVGRVRRAPAVGAAVLPAASAR